MAIRDPGMGVEQPNRMPEAEFVDMIAPLFEGAPHFLARLVAARPFAGESALFDAAGEIALAMPEAEQLELLDAHPRIGASVSVMSPASAAEQRAGEPTISAANEAVQATLDRLNTAYEARFGFRFVIFMNGRPRSQIVPIMERRLGGRRRDEKRRALVDVIAIAQDRWRRARER
jgi:2-oxo-4-hydroxy-4-carboxy-5-ureidoimidazoline decarboxylase